MTEVLDLEAVYRLLEQRIREAGSQAKWAERHGIKPGLVSDTLRARTGRKPSPSVIAALGLRPVVRYAAAPARAPSPRPHRTSPSSAAPDA